MEGWDLVGVEWRASTNMDKFDAPCLLYFAYVYPTFSRSLLLWPASTLHQPLIITAKTYCHVATEEWAVMFPFFHKSVILITDHEDEYTRGRSAGEDPLGITAIKHALRESPPKQRFNHVFPSINRHLQRVVHMFPIFSDVFPILFHLVQSLLLSVSPPCRQIRQVSCSIAQRPEAKVMVASNSTCGTAPWHWWFVFLCLFAPQSSSVQCSTDSGGTYMNLLQLVCIYLSIRLLAWWYRTGALEQFLTLRIEGINTTPFCWFVSHGLESVGDEQTSAPVGCWISVGMQTHPVSIPYTSHIYSIVKWLSLGLKILYL